MVFIRKFKRRLVRFLKRNEKRVALISFSLFIFIGPVFGGSLVGELLDKVLFVSTLVANGRILELC